MKFINATASVTLAPKHHHADADKPAAAVGTGTAAGRMAELRHQSTAQSSTAGLVHRSRSMLPPLLPAPELALKISTMSYEPDGEKMFHLAMSKNSSKIPGSGSGCG